MTVDPERLGPETFAAFAHARTPHLFRLAWLLCGHQAEAEDLVQETLTKVYVRVSKRFSAPLDHPATYAQTVLTNTFISTRRRSSSTELPYDDLPEAGVDDHASTSDIKMTLVEAFGWACADRSGGRGPALSGRCVGRSGRPDARSHSRGSSKPEHPRAGAAGPGRSPVGVAEPR